jgi:hypothetical protein
VEDQNHKTPYLSPSKCCSSGGRTSCARCSYTPTAPKTTPMQPNCSAPRFATLDGLSPTITHIFNAQDSCCRTKISYQEQPMKGAKSQTPYLSPRKCCSNGGRMSSARCSYTPAACRSHPAASAVAAARLSPSRGSGAMGFRPRRSSRVWEASCRSRAPYRYVAWGGGGRKWGLQMGCKWGLQTGCGNRVKEKKLQKNPVWLHKEARWT